MPQPAEKDEFIVIGKIGAPYGVKGWLKIHSFTEIPLDILQYDPWYLQESSDWKQIEVSDGRAHGKGVVAKFAGFDSPEQASLLTGKKLGVLREQLPKLTKNQFYWSDLEGLDVINDTGAVLGKVSYLLETGSNDVLVVQGEKEYLIPYLPGEIVTEVNLEKKTIHVKWEWI